MKATLKFSIDRNEDELMKVFNCDPTWPICTYDFSYTNKCPTYFCFRVGHDFNKLLKPDYFYSQKNPLPTGGSYRPFNALDIKSNLDLVIERNVHIC